MAKYFPVTERMVHLCRGVFLGTDDGRAVLTMMLRELGWFDAEPKEDYERGQVDYAKRLMRLLGVYHPKNSRRVIDALATLPPEWGREETQRQELRRVSGQ